MTKKIYFEDFAIFCELFLKKVGKFWKESSRKSQEKYDIVYFLRSEIRRN